MLADLKIPLLSLLIIGIFGVIFIPILPIDETRYVSVAWEMWTHHSFLVPHLNGVAYAHKPPLLFWLIQAGWGVFGVNEITPRLISPLASLANLLLLYKISLRLWPQDRKAASCAALLLGSTGLWLAWSCAIMFDVLLTVWVLVAVLGLLRMSQSEPRGWILLTLGIAGGMLTKGPVVLVYTVPLAVFGFAWAPDRPARWPLKTGSAFLAGFGLALLWAIPAALQGGKEYAEAIFWGQTAGRVSSSFAHHRPVYWYLPLIPVVLAPWVLFRPAFATVHFRRIDRKTRMLFIGLISSLVILSLISGKQVHYLIPLIPVVMLWMGRNIAQSKTSAGKTSMKVIGALYALLSLGALIIPLLPMGGDVGRMAHHSLRLTGCGLLFSGLILLFVSPHSVVQRAKIIAVCTLLVLLPAFSTLKTNFLVGYKIKPVATFIKQQQDAGRPIVHIGKYHGQYQFLGRMTKPLIVIDHDVEDAIDAFVLQHPNALFVSYQRGIEPDWSGMNVEYKQRYRGKDVVVWKKTPADASSENAVHPFSVNPVE